MKHRVKTRTLGRNQGHRKSMLRNLAKSLIEHGSIKTTVTRAKEVSSFVDKLITLAKKSSAAEDPSKALAFKRQVFKEITTQTSQNDRWDRMKGKERPYRDVAARLFDQLAVAYKDRSGGYSRVTKLQPRKGDGALLAKVELV